MLIREVGAADQKRCNIIFARTERLARNFGGSVLKQFYHDMVLKINRVFGSPHSGAGRGRLSRDPNEILWSAKRIV